MLVSAVTGGIAHIMKDSIKMCKLDGRGDLEAFTRT